VFGEKKFGGNAQSISKSRFIHHTSFLYDYDKALMDLLKSPRKQPEYRENRTHDDFVATLKSKYTEIGKEEESEDKRRELLLGAVYESLREHRDFEVRSVSFDAAENVLLDYNENVKPSTVKLWCDKERKWNVCDD
jgi:lipoate-protein ligase A